MAKAKRVKFLLLVLVLAIVGLGIAYASGGTMLKGAFDPLNPPDLTVTSIERSQSGLLEVTLANIGNGDSFIGIRHPAITIRIAGDLEKNYNYQTRFLADQGFIYAGGSSILSPRVLPDGYYEIEACIDRTNKVPETDDTNNCMFATIGTPSLPDVGVITFDDSDNPVLDDKVVAGEEHLVGRYKVYANDEAFLVEELSLIQVGSSMSTIDTLTLVYPTDVNAPATLDGSTSTMLVAGIANFTGMDMMVPSSALEENAVNFELYAETNDIHMGSDSGDIIVMDLDVSGEFKATGVDSGQVVTQDTYDGAYGNYASPDIHGNEIALYKSLPTFAKDTSPYAPCPEPNLVAASESEVYCFSVTAADQGDVGLFRLTFDVTATLLNTGTGAGQLAVANGWKLYEYDVNGTVSPMAIAEGTYASNKVETFFDSEEVVTAGTTSYYVLKGPISFTPDVDNSTLSVRLQEEHTDEHDPSTAAATVAGTYSWSDRSANAHSLVTTDWTHGYKLDGLPTEYATLSEA